jgi:hypothetical protein
MEKVVVGRPASDKTLLTTERRINKRLMNEMHAVSRERDGYRIRATKAEQELAEWKKRFDLLLARTPSPSAGERNG